jgi:hypothetical protein
VLFSVSRILGLSAQLVLNRAFNFPLIRPKSVTTKWIAKTLKEKNNSEQKKAETEKKPVEEKTEQKKVVKTN